MLLHIQKYLFKTWWVERGVDLFESRAPSTTVPIYKFARGGNSDKAKNNEAVARYLDTTRLKLNKPPAILLAIPRYFSRQKVLK